jgi:predicted MFS family arabinose efflux permease
MSTGSLTSSTGPSEGMVPEKPQSPGPAPGRGLLINRNFALLASGQAISNIGDFVYSTTLLVWVFALTHSAAAISGVLIAQYAPIFLLGPVAGVFVDRWNRRTTMIVADVTRALVALLPLVVPTFLRLPAIYASVFLLAAFARFFMPAKSGVLQVIVAEKQQPQAASISQATFALAFIIGPAIASPLYFAVGPYIAVSINAFSFLVSALCIVLLRVSRQEMRPALAVGAPQQRGGVGAIVRELLAGFGFVARTRVLLMVVVLSLIAMLGAGALNALDIVFVSQRLHVSTALYGPLTASAGMGTLLGAIVAGLIASKVSSRHMLAGSVFLLGVGLTVYAFQTNFLLALAVIFIASSPQGAIDVGFMPLMLSVTPKTLMGRVQSVIETGMYGMSLISIGLAGYVAQFVPVYIIFACCGLLFVISGLFGWFAIPEPPKEQKATTEV